MKPTVKFEVYLTVKPGRRSAEQVSEYLRGQIALAIGKLTDDFPFIEGVIVLPPTSPEGQVETVPVQIQKEVA